jgi:D-arginine dehydrogenase
MAVVSLPEKSQVRFRVRYAETDQMRVVYHANYLVWFEMARTELCRIRGVRYRDMERDDQIRFAVVDVHSRYHAPALFDDEIIYEGRRAAARPRLQWLTTAEALQRVGVLRPGAVAAALYDPDALDMDVHALLHGFLRGARRSGAALHLGAQLTAAHFDGARWVLRFRDGRELRARTVVNAAGAWADVLAAQLGATPIGLVPKRRSAFTFRAPEGVASAHWPLVIGVDESWYFKPDAGQLLGSPANADPTEPQDVQPEALDIALGIHAIETVSTLSIRRPTATWAGLRSFVADGEPVIGFDPQCPGLFWHAAFGGYGIQSAVGASTLAASLLRGDGVPHALQREGLEVRSVEPARLR